MLTIKNVYNNQMRRFLLESEPSLIPDSRSSRRQSIEQSKLINEPENISDLTDDTLLERITKINKENVMMNRENLMFARYLLRITTSKISESFNDYETEENIISETLQKMKEMETHRELTPRKSIITMQGGVPILTRRSSAQREYHNILYIRPIDKERFFIANYELEQATLDWQRMKAHSDASLENLKILCRNINSVATDQNDLNRNLQRQIDKFRNAVGEQQYNNPYLAVPGELFAGRALQLINHRISLTGALFVNSEHLRLRIEEIDERIEKSSNAIAKIGSINIDMVTQKNIRTKEEYENLSTYCITAKSSLHGILKNVEEFKIHLIEEQAKVDKIHKRIKFLNTFLEQTINDINIIQQENKEILKENRILNNLLEQTFQSPTIIQYAHIIKKVKSLHDDIHIWTRKVKIAEGLFAQLKQQTKRSTSLPPMRRKTTFESEKRIVEVSHH